MKMMQCPMQLKEDPGFLLDYCARRTDPVAIATVEDHLRVCTSCRELISTQRSVWDSLDGWEAFEVSPDFNRRLFARIDAENARNPFERWISMLLARWSPFSWGPAVAAAVTCAILIGALWLQPSFSRTRVEEREAQIDRADVEQVERTMQDLEMLKALNPSEAPGANSSGSI